MTAMVAASLSVAEAAARRRAIRAYRADPIPCAAIEAVLRVASLAPSAFNLQPWRFVVVERDDVKRALAAAAGNQRQTLSAPALVALYTDAADAIATAAAVAHPSDDPERRSRARQAIDRYFSPKTAAEREAWGVGQGYIALGFLLLAAESVGLQTSPMLGFDASRVKTILGLPDHVGIPALIAIGHGDEDGRPHHRHALDRIVRFV